MAAADRFGLRFSSANARKPASCWGHKAKTRANSHPVQPQKFGPLSRVNSYDMPSRVETIIPRRGCVTQLRACGPYEYHYGSINTERRNSENCWSNCGNPAPLSSTHFRNKLINKHLDLFQDGPRLANHVPPARVPRYWCPES